MNRIFFTLLVLVSLVLNFQESFSQGKNIRLIGKSNPLNGNSGINYSALWGYSANGREYAILGGVGNTYFIDITDSTNIRVCAALSGVFSQWREMKTYSHYAYVVSEGGMGVQIFDLAGLPNSVTYVGEFHATDHTTTHSIQQSGPYLYLNGANATFGHGIAVLDLSVNPEVPVLRGKWNDYYVHDCRVINDTIWAANIYDGKVSIINAANKNNLTNITNWTNGQNPFPHNCAITPGRKFAFVTDETSTPPGRLKIWNVQDLSNIILANTWAPSNIFSNCIIHNVELYGNQLAVAYYTAGVKLLDVSTPSNPVEMGWYDTYPENNSNEFNGCWGVYMFPSGKIIASDRTRGLYVLRYAPPQNAAPKADFMTNGTIYYNGNTAQLIDCASNNPTTYQWTITGPQNYSFDVPNPFITFNTVGYYTVKLKVSNAFGSDSLTKTDYIKVNGSVLSGFSLTSDVIQTIITNPNDTSKVNFNWTNSSIGGVNITYKFRIKKNGASTENYYLSNHNGQDTAITFTKSRLDSIAHQLGLTGDSIVTICKVTAYNGLDSVASANSLRITFKSTSVGIQNISTQIPDKFKLENNFPNPFNPSTNIKFQLSEKSFTSLIVYDMLGREVMTLLGEELNAGYYNYQFNASTLNSGIYFYTLKTEKNSETKKMVLVK
ncbi:MAG: choice-of-anchor B family protein [Bacteroidetes bacterium]|nr:choice-of-anchor B family protein [Bacteroidota bacterium]